MSEKVQKIIKYVANEVAAGKNFFVFPEGTRSRDGNNILEFKGGTFKIAVIVIKYLIIIR